MNKVKILALLGVVLALTGCAFKKSTDQYLREKYNMKFTYVKEIDRDEYHYKDPYNRDLIVKRGKKGCIDNYYKIRKQDEIDNYAYNALKSLTFLNNYKFFVGQNSVYYDERVTLDTPIEEAMKVDSLYRLVDIRVFVYEDVNLNMAQLQELYDKKIQLSINKVSYSDYQLFNTDYRNYIYDYIQRTKISVGINDRYAFIKTQEIYFK